MVSRPDWQRPISPLLPIPGLPIVKVVEVAPQIASEPHDYEISYWSKQEIRVTERCNAVDGFALFDKYKEMDAMGLRLVGPHPEHPSRREILREHNGVKRLSATVVTD